MLIIKYNAQIDRKKENSEKIEEEEEEEIIIKFCNSLFLSLSLSL